MAAFCSGAAGREVKKRELDGAEALHEIFQEIEARQNFSVPIREDQAITQKEQPLNELRFALALHRRDPRAYVLLAVKSSLESAEKTLSLLDVAYDSNCDIFVPKNKASKRS